MLDPQEANLDRAAGVVVLAVELPAVAVEAGFDLSAYWSESTRRFERDIYRGTADVRLSARGRKLLCSESAAVEDAIARAAPEVDAEGWLRVAIPIESIRHATGQLLSLGTDVEVLGPSELRERVRDTARDVTALYAGRPGAKPAPRTRRTRAAR